MVAGESEAMCKALQPGQSEHLDIASMEGELERSCKDGALWRSSFVNGRDEVVVVT